jgi:altronate hydrolase
MTPVTKQAIGGLELSMSQASPALLPSDAPALLRLHGDDDVAVALRPIDPGESLDIAGAARIVAIEPIPRGHKIALAAFGAGREIRKFGWPIGRLTRPVAAGAQVHSHNLETGLSGLLAYSHAPVEPAPLPQDTAARFIGYRRPDGRVATRNEVWVLPTVGCVARAAERIATIAHARHSRTVDGVYAFRHPHGCSQLGDDLEGTRALLAALACHPNAGGVLLIGLGCESNALDALVAEIPDALRGRVRTLRAQGVEDEIEAGLAEVESLVAMAALARRQPAGLSELVIGLKCGGSDGLSGLTANPLVGRITDLIIGSGGSALLTEVPEMFGAEQLLMNRARDRRVFDRTVALINDFKRYFLAHGQPVSENPSPGNIAGGITTLEEKSLGAVQKAGQAPVVDVLPYGARLRRAGLSLVEAPGNDAVSSTALAAAGATLILFTTGRGTPLGFPVPTVKIASNGALAARKPGWIDFDAGRVLDDGFDAAAQALAARLIAFASGEPTAAERNGEREMAIWKRGVTL